MRELQIHGGIAIVDDEDYEMLSKYKWHVDNNGYAKNNYRVGKKTYSRRMHRLVMNAQKGELIDHENQNKLDNRKTNLRRATQSQNRTNAKMREDNTSGFRGVDWIESRKKFQARVTHERKQHFLGFFDTAKEAALAYNRAALEFHGEFAFQNKIEEEE